VVEVDGFVGGDLEDFGVGWEVEGREGDVRFGFGGCCCGGGRGGEEGVALDREEGSEGGEDEGLDVRVFVVDEGVEVRC
jgi:hypothetical protein